MSEPAGDDSAKTPQQLSEDELRTIKKAHARLRNASTALDPFLAVNPLSGDKEIEMASVDFQLAMEEYHLALEEVNHLHEELLGWRRPHYL